MARLPEGSRSPCPIGCTLDLIGDRWTLLVLRDLLAGRERFSDLRDGPEGIATNILTARLELLVGEGLVERRPIGTSSRSTYHLTRMGLSLRPVLRAIREWGLAHIPGTAEV